MTRHLSTVGSISLLLSLLLLTTIFTQFPRGLAPGPSLFLPPPDGLVPGASPQQGQVGLAGLEWPSHDDVNEVRGAPKPPQRLLKPVASPQPDVLVRESPPHRPAEPLGVLKGVVKRLPSEYAEPPDVGVAGGCDDLPDGLVRERLPRVRAPCGLVEAAWAAQSASGSSRRKS